MASSINDLFVAVRNAYEAALPAPQQGVIKWRFGAEHVHAELNWPRVVCVRQGATYEPLSKPGTAVPMTGEVRNIYNRRTTVEWHCWGADDEAAETLATNIIGRIRAVTGATQLTQRPVSETWVRSELKDVSGGGQLCILVTEIVHVINDEVRELPVTEIDASEHTGTFGPSDEVVC